MNRAVYDVLSALPGEKAEGLVFRKANGAAWGPITTAFGVALRKAGITAFRFHDLRHTAASWWAMQGRSLLEIKELLGHSDLAMVIRYAHLAPGRLREAVSSLDGLFEEQAKPAAEASLNGVPG